MQTYFSEVLPSTLGLRQHVEGGEKKEKKKSLSEGCHVSKQNSLLPLKISMYDYYFTY